MRSRTVSRRGTGPHAARLDPRGRARRACARHRFPRPRITLEPGRAIVARSGVTVYRIVSVKHIEDGRTFVSVDGGMSDNPGSASTGLVRRRARQPASGRRAGSDDRRGTTLRIRRRAGRGRAAARGLHPGDVIAIPCTGAYQPRPRVRYNSVGRPADHRGVQRLGSRTDPSRDDRRPAPKGILALAASRGDEVGLRYAGWPRRGGGGSAAAGRVGEPQAAPLQTSSLRRAAVLPVTSGRTWPGRRR